MKARDRAPFWAAALLIFTLVVFVCDLVPKVAALLNPYRYARIGVRVLRPLMRVLDPVSRILQRLSENIAERDHARAAQDRPLPQ